LLTTHNVPGAFSSNKGKDFAAVLEEITKIVEPQAPGIEVPEKGWPTWGGYHDEVGGRWSVVWRTHDAQYWGVPQRRRRISVVADFGGDTASEIQFDGESVSGDIAESGASGEGFAEAAEAGASYAVRIRGGCDGGGKGALVQTEKCGTLDTGNNQTIFQSCITPWDCQSKRIFGTSGEAPTLQGGIGGGVNNPAIFCMATQQGGAELRTDDRAPTLTAAAGMSGNNQPVVCAGFKLGNSEQARSIGYQEELSPTLNAECGGNKPAVVAPAVALDMTPACDVIRECGEQVPALQARMGTGGNQVPLTYQDVTGTLSPGAHAGSYNGQDAYNDMLVCGASPDVAHALRAKSACAYREDAETYPVQNMVVRRLTPLECSRLQGYPDGWVEIGEWTDEKGKKHKDADSQKYKALGNSIALPFWDWMLRRMARYLPEGATLGSLFDGIAGFPLIWERIHGKGSARWASEIEQFPIAVTKKWFGEE
jgi:DNA (cytosine-5)-methyltransferase 1